MENEIKPVQSSMPLGKDEWTFVQSNGNQVAVVVDRGANLLDALWEQKKIGVEFSKSIFLDSNTREVRDTLTNTVEGYMYRGNHLA